MIVLWIDRLLITIGLQFAINKIDRKKLKKALIKAVFKKISYQKGLLYENKFKFPRFFMIKSAFRSKKAPNVDNIFS